MRRFRDRFVFMQWPCRLCHRMVKWFEPCDVCGGTNPALVTEATKEEK